MNQDSPNALPDGAQQIAIPLRHPGAACEQSEQAGLGRDPDAWDHALDRKADTAVPRPSETQNTLADLVLRRMGPGLVPLAPFGHSRRRDDVGGVGREVPLPIRTKWKPL